MIYLSAQPATDYFLWQLKLQILNFKQIGLKKDEIHVLLSYSSKDDVSVNFSNFIKSCNDATFFLYRDTRKEYVKAYQPTIRTHILYKHFRKYKWLEKEVIFYHDSDIFFRERIDESLFINDDIWYLSDTRTYTSASYVKNISESLFRQACEIAKVSPKLIEENQNNSGGAQHVMKNIDANYWKDVEEVALNIYNLFMKFNEESKSKVQAWCADMFAVFWMGLKRGERITIHKEMEFTWPTLTIDNWYSTKILHNSGHVHKFDLENFSKHNYRDTSPFFANFGGVSKYLCSYIIAQKVKEYEQEEFRTTLKDVCFVIKIKDECSSFDSSFIDAYSRYILKHYDTEIFIISDKKQSYFKNKNIHEEIQYIQHRNCLNILLEKNKSEYIFHIDSGLFLDINQIDKSIQKIRSDKTGIVIPFTKTNETSLDAICTFNRSLNFRDLEINSNTTNLKKGETYLISAENYYKYCKQIGFDFYEVSLINEVRLNMYRILNKTIYQIEGEALFYYSSHDNYLSVINDNYFKEQIHIHLTSLNKEMVNRYFERIEKITYIINNITKEQNSIGKNYFKTFLLNTEDKLDSVKTQKPLNIYQKEIIELKKLSFKMVKKILSKQAENEFIILTKNPSLLHNSSNIFRAKNIIVTSYIRGIDLMVINSDSEKYQEWEALIFFTDTLPYLSKVDVFENVDIIGVYKQNGLNIEYVHISLT